MIRTSYFPNTFEVVQQLSGTYAAKPERGPAWIIRMIRALADVIDKCRVCADFYSGKRYLPAADLLGAYITRKDGLLDVWSSCFSEICVAKPPQNADEAIHDLHFMMVSLAVELVAVCGFDEHWYYPSGGEGVIPALRARIERDDGETREDLRSAVQDYSWNLAETAYRLSLREYAIVHEHRDWEVLDLERDEVKGPIDGRGISDAIHAALAEYEAAHPKAFSNLRLALKGLDACNGIDPVAFVMKDVKIGGRFSFAAAVKDALCLPQTIAYANPPGVAELLDEPEGRHVPSKFLAKARFRFIWRFRKFLMDRAEAVGRNSAARRMWYEAAAEFLSKVEWGLPVFTPPEADRIIALANAAQREHWIERRLKEHGGAPDEDVFAPDPASEMRPRVMAHEPRADVSRLESMMEDIRERLSEKGDRRPGRPKDPLKAKRNPRRGSGNHGTRTEKMAQQMSEFKTYLKDHPIGKTFNPNYRADGWWRLNKADCEAAAKAEGEKRGYASSVKVASAYRSWLRAEATRRPKKVGTKPKKRRE